MRRIPDRLSVLTVTSATPSTVLPAAGEAMATRLAGPPGGAVVVVGTVVCGGRVVEVVVVDAGGGAVVAVVAVVDVVDEGGGGGGGAEGAPGSPGAEVGPIVPEPFSVEKGLMVVLLPAASSWKAEVPFCTRIRVPDSRFLI